MSQNSNLLIPNSRRAYRAWRVDSTCKLLCLTRPAAWPDSVLIAKCDTNSLQGYTLHKSPDEKCSCGIYAKYRLADLWSEIDTRVPSVLGAVDISGKTFEHTRGVRAERATIRGLWISPFVDYDIRGYLRYNLEKHYGVPVFKSDEELLDAYPPDTDIPKSSDRRIHERQFIIGTNWGSATVVSSGSSGISNPYTIASSTTSTQAMAQILKMIDPQ